MTTLALPTDATLAQCEAVIEAHQDSFLAVMEALAVIKDGNLFKATHRSFEAYCRERWGFGADSAYRRLAVHRAITAAPEGAPIPSQRSAVKSAARARQKLAPSDESHAVSPTPGLAESPAVRKDASDADREWSHRHTGKAGTADHVHFGVPGHSHIGADKILRQPASEVESDSGIQMLANPGPSMRGGSGFASADSPEATGKTEPVLVAGLGASGGEAQEVAGEGPIREDGRGDRLDPPPSVDARATSPAAPTVAALPPSGSALFARLLDVLQDADPAEMAALADESQAGAIFDWFEAFQCAYDAKVVKPKPARPRAVPSLPAAPTTPRRRAVSSSAAASGGSREVTPMFKEAKVKK